LVVKRRGAEGMQHTQPTLAEVNAVGRGSGRCWLRTMATFSVVCIGSEPRLFKAHGALQPSLSHASFFSGSDTAPSKATFVATAGDSSMPGDMRHQTCAAKARTRDNLACTEKRPTRDEWRTHKKQGDAWPEASTTGAMADRGCRAPATPANAV